MKCAEEYMRLYAVTDRAWVGGQTLYQQVESALKGGVTCVQLREKELDEEAFLKEAFELHDLCKKYNVPFFINDNVHYEGIDLSQEEFFRLLAEDANVSTSQPSPGDVMDLWNKLLKEYDEIVYIPMSSGLSASCATALALAADFEGSVFVAVSYTHLRAHET